MFKKLRPWKHNLLIHGCGHKEIARFCFSTSVWHVRSENQNRWASSDEQSLLDRFWEIQFSCHSSCVWRNRSIKQHVVGKRPCTHCRSEATPSNGFKSHPWGVLFFTRRAMLQLGIYRTHYLLVVPFLQLSIFRLFFINCSCVIASGVGMVGHFPPRRGKLTFEENKKCFRQILAGCPAGCPYLCVDSIFSWGAGGVSCLYLRWHPNVADCLVDSTLLGWPQWGQDTSRSTCPLTREEACGNKILLAHKWNGMGVPSQADIGLDNTAQRVKFHEGHRLTTLHLLHECTVKKSNVSGTWKAYGNWAIVRSGRNHPKW